MRLNAKITALGGYVPPGIRTNAWLSDISDTSDEWILKRTGIRERRILANDLGTSDMVVEAVQNLLMKAEITVEEIACLIVATSTPDMPMPSTANIVCRKLGIKQTFGFDINAACSGFLYALSLGASLVESCRYKNVIVVGADKMSSVLNKYDRTTNILFGDGAAAVLLQSSTEKAGVMDSILEGNGEGMEFLNIEGGGSRYPASMETLLSKKHFIKQEGRVVFRNAIAKMVKVCRNLLEQNQLSIKDISWFVPHQANLRIIEAVGKELGIENEKILTNVQYYGNTTAATIPLCLWDYEATIKKGDLLLLTTFGAGFTWGATLIKWDI
ncbi:3-oxoacyl-ACP synthase [Flavobacterium sediminis]|uniref:Beta-ketoacyl-[acyl-carrier-protein] synthase III n=1 Tax=Flavobacterium sediminis TaxID=2201181 RepID=A0A2U8QVF8_9FLAO|nr:beta-ketoacyl-ACP synthase III [Flavobacterium sediminis]AWM14113.1 3-oxoacyl-ACP synthase [Flavobacterium sediminis]